MLTLATTETLQGKAGTAAAITYTIFGDAVGSSDDFKKLAQGQLASSTGVLYTVPGGGVLSALIKEIHLANTTGSAVTGITLYVGGTAAANQLTGTITIPANGTAVYSEGGWRIYDANGGNFFTATTSGDVAHDGIDSGNPVKMGGKVTTAVPAAVANADRTDAWFDPWGRQAVSDMDPEVGVSSGMTGLRDRLIAERYTALADSLADGINPFWTSTVANGGTTVSANGEAVIATSANAAGAARLVSTVVNYYPGQVAWMNSAVRFSDTGSAGNIRRLGMFTVDGSGVPQNGFYFELNGTTLNAVVVKAGVATAVASTSWSRVVEAPFTLDTNYHSFEIRYTANTVWFYVDNVLRHRVSGTTSAITATLNFPIVIQSVNTSGATDRQIIVRNIGTGGFGNPDTKPQSTNTVLANVTMTGASVVLAAANTSRRGLMIFNDSGVVVYVKLGATASATSFTVKLPDQTYYELPPPMYNGVVEAFGASGSVRVTEVI